MKVADCGQVTMYGAGQDTLASQEGHISAHSQFIGRESNDIMTNTKVYIASLGRGVGLSC